MEYGVASAEQCARRVYSEWLAVIVNVSNIKKLEVLESVILHMQLEIVQLSKLPRERDVLVVA